MLPALITGMAASPQWDLSPDPSPFKRGEQTSIGEANGSGDLQNALGVLFVGIDAGLHLVDDRLVDHQLPIVADGNLESIHRAWRRSFEIQAADVIAGAVARTLELLLSLEPSRGASEVGALGEDRVEAGLGADNPGAEVLLVFLADLADYVIVGEAGLELRRRQEQHARKGRANRGQEPNQRKNPEP